jgi:UDP-GlcNAc:undecaprenyl-phosphate GlcNAc-1-phosphate transferase
MAEYRNAGMILVMVGLATYIGLRKLGYHEISFGKITTLLSWYEQTTFKGIFYVAFLDIILLGLSYWGAFLLKYDLPQPASTTAWYTHAFPVVLAVQFFALYACGLYRGVCGATNVADLVRIVLAVAAGGALSYVICQLSIPPEGNLAFFCIGTLLLIGLVACSRNINSILEYTKTVRLHDRRGGLIYGAGRSEQFLVQALSQETTLKIRPIGYLDENPLLQERRINDLPVLGSYKDLASILAAHPISTLIFSSDRIIDEQLRAAISFCKLHHILVLRAGLELEAVDSVSLPLPSSYWAETKHHKKVA